MTIAATIDLAAVKRACERYGVRRLRVFGSSVTDRFDPATSDLDVLVEFEPDRVDRFSDYFELHEALEELAGRPVDLVTLDSMRNPYFRAEVLAAAEDL